MPAKVQGFGHRGSTLRLAIEKASERGRIAGRGIDDWLKDI